MGGYYGETRYLPFHIKSVLGESEKAITCYRNFFCDIIYTIVAGLKEIYT